MPPTLHETVYSGPPLEARPPRIPEPDRVNVEEVERDLNLFIAHIFGWIAGALLLSAMMANYSDRLDLEIPGFISGNVIFMLLGGLILFAYFISKKIVDIPREIAIAALIGYAGIQGALFGVLYRGAYRVSLAPVYLIMAAVFSLLCVCGWYSKFDLSSIRSLLLGGALAFLVPSVSMPLFDLDMETVCASCAASWLMLSLVCYHRDFLRDLPNSFEDDAHWNKAVAVGALKIYFDLLTTIIIVLQARWIRDSIAQLTEKEPKN